jgi:catechol 2,3-dioxygenase-like lactoylglutathione lyase family enzyme
MEKSNSALSAPVSAVVISVANLETSLAFYEQTLGLDVTETRTWQGAAFERYWHLPAGAKARCAMLAYGPDPVGRVQLMEFDAPNRKQIRKPGIKRATGLFNLNIYSSDVKRDYADLKAQGYEFWGEPNHLNFGPAVGEALEFAFEGPDGVVINLVEPLTHDPKTMIGHLYEFMNNYGRTPRGFTPVATTAHTVADTQKALDFYYGPLGMKLFAESEIAGEATNRAMGIPADARTRSVIIQGNHEYGKIALAQPLNYEVPNLVPDAIPPNIGYVAQSFQVGDLEAAAVACAALDADVYTAMQEIDLPGRGVCRAMIVRNPGSGALQELFQL